MIFVWFVVIAIMGLAHVPPLPGAFWFLVTLASLLGGTLLAVALGLAAIISSRPLRSGKMNEAQASSTFLLLSLVLYLVPLCMFHLLDRYFVPMLPVVAASIVALPSPSLLVRSRIRPLLSAVIISLFLVFSVLGTHDYFSWNRARWEASNDLLENKAIPPEQIDGGFEFNGLYLYDPQYALTQGKSWWWVVDDTYIIAFGPIPGYSIVQSYGYERWMPPQPASIVVLKRAVRD